MSEVWNGSDAYVVIGAGFGDEGKGLMTDYLVRRTGADSVLRFNGGAQASHTVTTPTGLQHIFSHLGAGTFAGARTILGPRFIINPYLLQSELRKLQAVGYSPEIVADADAPVTTIFDMAINATAEIMRGAGRHGSCGIGINETVTRHSSFPLFASDIALASVQSLSKKMQQIHSEWVPARLKALGLDGVSEEIILKTGDVLRNDNYEQHALILKQGFNNIAIASYDTELSYDMDLWSPSRPIVMEGAQGLMLDEEFGLFPHVTRSLTGLKYAMQAAERLWASSIQPVYVTRCYATRHGAGPLLHDGEVFTERTIVETTNVTNQWQGTIRFAPLHLGELRRFIKADLERARETQLYTDLTLEDPVIAVTCLDQVGPEVVMYDNDGQRRVIPASEIVTFIEGQLGYRVGYKSFGPTSEDVVSVAGVGV